MKTSAIPLLLSTALVQKARKRQAHRFRKGKAKADRGLCAVGCLVCVCASACVLVLRLSFPKKEGKRTQQPHGEAQGAQNPTNQKKRNAPFLTQKRTRESNRKAPVKSSSSEAPEASAEDENKTQTERLVKEKTTWWRNGSLFCSVIERVINSREKRATRGAYKVLLYIRPFFNFQRIAISFPIIHARKLKPNAPHAESPTGFFTLSRVKEKGKPFYSPKAPTQREAKKQPRTTILPFPLLKADWLDAKRERSKFCLINVK